MRAGASTTRVWPELENQQTTQQAALDSAYNALVQFLEGVASYRSGLASYNDGVDTLEEGWQDVL